MSEGIHVGRFNDSNVRGDLNALCVYPLSTRPYMAVLLSRVFWEDRRGGGGETGVMGLGGGGVGGGGGGAAWWQVLGGCSNALDEGKAGIRENRRPTEMCGGGESERGEARGGRGCACEAAIVCTSDLCIRAHVFECVSVCFHVDRGLFMRVCCRDGKRTSSRV